MEIKTKFNIGEKVFFTSNSILTVVKTALLSNDKEIFDLCYGERFVVGIRISFDVIDKKPITNYILADTMNVDDENIIMLEQCGASYSEDLISNNREELEKMIHDVHIAELKILNDKILNLMK